MGALVILKAPYPEQPYPVENCMNYCMDILDVIETPGVAAFYTITLFDSQPQAFGQRFTFAGVEFEVSADQQGFSGGSLVNWTSSANSTNAIRLFSAIIGHPSFINSITGIITPGGGSTTLTFVWNTLGEQDNWIFDYSELTHNPVVNGINGTDIGYIPGFAVGYKVTNADDDIDVIPLQELPPIYDSLGNLLEVCVNVSPDFSKVLKTTIPDCDNQGQYDNTIMKQVGFYYGTIQTKPTGCGVDLVNFNTVKDQYIINSAWNVDDGDFQGWFDYSQNGKVGHLVKFLTTKPSGLKMCRDQCDWLWIIANNRTLFPSITSSYFSRAKFYDSSGVFIAFRDFNFTDDGVYIIPTGTLNVDNGDPLLLWDDVCYYETQVFVVLSVAPFVLEYSEIYRTYVTKGCCDTTGVYFLDSKGGYTFLEMDYQDDEVITSEFTEICRDVICNDSYSEQLQGNKMNLNSKAQSVVKLRSRVYQKTEQLRLLFKAFKASEYRFMMFDGKPRHMLAEAGSTKIFQHDEYIEIFVTLKDAQYFKTQSQG